MLFAFNSTDTDGRSAIGDTSRVLVDRSGALKFRISAPLNRQVSEIELTSVRLPNGAGETFGVVTKGDYRGANQTECRDETFHVTFFQQGSFGA